MRILVIPDLHCPYQHPDALAFLRDVSRSFRPDEVVCLGDEIDAHAISRWPTDPDLPSIGHELAAAIEALRPLYSLFPTVSVCESNHTLRPWRRARESGLPGRVIRPVRDVLSAPEGWVWKHLHRIDNVVFLHGDGFSGPTGALNAAMRFRSRVVIGHLHAHAGVVWSHGLHDAVFGMNAGCLIDPSHPAFSYARYNPFRPSLGCGLIEDGIPRWIPLHTRPSA